MSKSTKLAIFLALMFVVSNAWWAYRALDLGVSLTYARDGQEEAIKLADQTLAVLNVVISPEPSRTRVMAAAALEGNSVDPYEKLGFTWVDGLGLKFGNDGHLLKVVTNEEGAEK